MFAEQCLKQSTPRVKCKNLEGCESYRRKIGRFFLIFLRGRIKVPSPTSISKPNKVHQFQFQISKILLFMGVSKIQGPEILRFLPCMLQFLDNFLWFFIFCKYIRNINTSLHVRPSEKFLIVNDPKETTMNKSLNVVGGILDLLKSFFKIREKPA